MDNTAQAAQASQTDQMEELLLQENPGLYWDTRFQMLQNSIAKLAEISDDELGQNFQKNFQNYRHDLKTKIRKIKLTKTNEAIEQIVALYKESVELSQHSKEAILFHSLKEMALNLIESDLFDIVHNTALLGFIDKEDLGDDLLNKVLIYLENNPDPDIFYNFYQNYCEYNADFIEAFDNRTDLESFCQNRLNWSDDTIGEFCEKIDENTAEETISKPRYPQKVPKDSFLTRQKSASSVSQRSSLFSAPVSDVASKRQDSLGSIDEDHEVNNFDSLRLQEQLRPQQDFPPAVAARSKSGEKLQPKKPFDRYNSSNF